MKKILIASLLLACSAANASMFGSPDVINLGGGEVAPRQTLKLDVSAFIPIVKYNITCDITDPNNTKNPVIMAFGPSMNVGTGVGWFVLNGIRMESYQAQAKLTKVNNTLLMAGVSNFPYNHVQPSIAFTNADTSDSVTVSNCIAKVQV